MSKYGVQTSIYLSGVGFFLLVKRNVLPRTLPCPILKRIISKYISYLILRFRISTNWTKNCDAANTQKEKKSKRAAEADRGQTG